MAVSFAIALNRFNEVTMNELFRFISNPTTIFAINCCIGPVILFSTGLLVGLLAGRGYSVRLERGR